MGELVGATIRMTAPILLAAMGGLLSARAGVFNIALEGLMLVGAFAVIAGAQFGGSTAAGLVAAVLAGAGTALVFAFVILRLRADVIIAGLAINILALGLTTFLLKLWFGVEGSFTSSDISGLPTVDLPFLPATFFLNRLSVLVYVAWILVLLVSWFLYRTPWGLTLRAVGEFPAAATTAGIDVRRVRYLAIAASGALCGLAGAQLANGYLTGTFTENMTAGRGYLAFTAVIFGAAQPLLVLAASLLLGVADAIGVRLQLLQIPVPAEFVLMAPYILTLLALWLTSVVRNRSGRLPVDELALSEQAQEAP